MVSDKQARQTARKRWLYNNDPEFRERKKAIQRKYNTTHPDPRTADDRREWREQYYQANADYLRAQSSEYRKAHLPYYAEKMREYREAHPEYVEAMRKLEREKQRYKLPEVQAYIRRWREENADDLRRKAAIYTRERRQNDPVYNEKYNAYQRAWHFQRYWGDAVFRENMKTKTRQRRVRNAVEAAGARRALRSLMMMDPRIAELINSYIDLSSASDVEVKRFYLALKEGFE